MNMAKTNPRRRLNTLRDWFTRRHAAEAETFINLLRQAAALLSAGRPVHSVWAELAPLHRACTNQLPIENPQCCIHHVLRAQHANLLLGRPLFAATTGPGDGQYWQQLSGCLRLCARTGMPVAVVLSRLADALDAGEDAHQARQSAAAGPRSTARLLSWLPAAGLGLSAILGTTVFDLLTHPAGWALLIVGLGLAIGGRLWSNRMIRSAEEV